jgi:chorismate mutase
VEALGRDRARIEAIDAQLLRLLNRRAAIVRALHGRKARSGRAVYDARRTDAILDRLLRLNRGPLDAGQLLALFVPILHHFALEHRPGARAPAPLFVGAVGRAGLARAAARLRRHGIAYLRLPAATPGARRLCDAHGLKLVLPASSRAGVAASVADVVEVPAARVRALAPALVGRAVLVTREAAAAHARRAGAREVLAPADVRSARGREAAVLRALRAGAPGAILPVRPDDDDEALAGLLHRARLLWHALRPFPGASRR